MPARAARPSSRWICGLPVLGAVDDGAAAEGARRQDHPGLPRQPVMVMADRIRLEQVIINLLRNALDATKGVAEPRRSTLILCRRARRRR
jgi:C4-dicarboxylate-specific signal transduction histidine kinase